MTDELRTALTAEEQVALIRRSLADGLVLVRFAGSVPIFRRSPAAESGLRAALTVRDLDRLLLAQVPLLRDALLAEAARHALRDAHVPSALEAAEYGLNLAAEQGYERDVAYLDDVLEALATVREARAALRATPGDLQPDREDVKP